MSLKRLILSGLTLLVTFLIGLSLWDSLHQPQVQNQLELYQTNLVLQASAWKGFNEGEVGNLEQTRRVVLGAAPIQNAVEKYEQARQSLQKQLQGLGTETAPEMRRDVELPHQLSSARLQTSLAEIELRLGLLYTQTDQVDKALATWATLQDSRQRVVPERFLISSEVLQTLWAVPPHPPADAEAQLSSTLTGWFRDQALLRLYQVQGLSQDRAVLEQAQQQAAEQAWGRLVLVAVLPSLGGFSGVVILLLGLVRVGLKRYRQPNSGLNKAEIISSQPSTDIPWRAETIWQVMVLWFTAFFGISVFIVPLIARVLGVTPGGVDALTQAIFALVSYGLLMATGFTILYLSLKPFATSPIAWLRLKLSGSWFWWGMGGYLAALPLVVGISLLNQQLLQDQGGSNPILEIIISSQDRLTIGILFLMVAVLAPLFEETLFRGFFLTSLTRYLPTWGAIALSGCLFAVAHLNVADILPLTVLGMVLGYVYLRSGNLLASILLHGIWNSGSFLGLLLLSSSS